MKQAGYREYEPDNFQKRVEDTQGIRYYINAKFYQIRDLTIWGFNVQMETSHGAIQIELVQWFNGIYSKNTIDDAELYFDGIWQYNGKPYYEMR